MRAILLSGDENQLKLAKEHEVPAFDKNKFEAATFTEILTILGVTIV